MTVVAPNVEDFTVVLGEVTFSDAVTLAVGPGITNLSQVLCDEPFPVSADFKLAVKIGPPTGPKDSYTDTIVTVATNDPSVSWSEIRIRVRQFGLWLDYKVRATGNYVTLISIDDEVLYDPVANQWFRLNISNGVLSYEASRNGSTWEVLASTPWVGAGKIASAANVNVSFGATFEDDPWASTTDWSYFGIENGGTPTVIFAAPLSRPLAAFASLLSEELLGVSLEVPPRISPVTVTK